MLLAEMEGKVNELDGSFKQNYVSDLLKMQFRLSESCRTNQRKCAS